MSNSVIRYVDTSPGFAGGKFSLPWTCGQLFSAGVASQGLESSSAARRRSTCRVSGHTGIPGNISWAAGPLEARNGSNELFGNQFYTISDGIALQQLFTCRRCRKKI